MSISYTFLDDDRLTTFKTLKETYSLRPGVGAVRWIMPTGETMNIEIRGGLDELTINDEAVAQRDAEAPPSYPRPKF